MNKSLLGLSLAACLGFATTAHAADVVLVNQDAAGVGLNDTTPAAAVGGNPGKTRGEQARIVYQFAADMWGGVLESPLPIYVAASFAPLTCSTSSGTLAQAGTTFVVTGGSPTRAYGSALGDAVFGFDLITYFYPNLVGYPDIFSQFNGALGSPGCLDGLSWYFGLDGNTPEGQVNFLNVVMHEIGHGLGMQGQIDKTTGVLNYGVPDTYTANAYDNVVSKQFTVMTNAERALAMRSPGRTVWTGANVNYNASLLLDGGYQETVLRVTAPAPVAKDYPFFTAAFGPAATPANFNGQWVAATDAVEAADDPDGLGVGTATDGCNAITNAAAINGNVAMIERGRCGFAVKVKNAQNAGATAVVIVNSAAGTLGTMGGSDPTITIPSVQVQRADGLAFIANAPVTGGMAQGPVTLAGTDAAGRTRLYSPLTVAGGSTFSHFDTVVAPNALMEPFDTPSVQAHVNVDMTAGLFADIGWQLNPGNGKLKARANYACDTGVDAVADGGFVLGANLQANHAMCANAHGTPTKYVQCMSSQAKALQDANLLSLKEYQKVTACARQVMNRLP